MTKLESANEIIKTYGGCEYNEIKCKGCMLQDICSLGIVYSRTQKVDLAKKEYENEQ